MYPRGPISTHHRTTMTICLSVAVGVVLTVRAGQGRAQCTNEARQEIRDMNSKSMEAYQNMEFNTTQKLLSHAFKLAESKGCNLDWIHAYTLMNLAVLSIGGKNKTGLGKRFMTMALKIHPEAPLDKALATPELKKVYSQVRKKLRITETPKPWPKLDIETGTKAAPGEKPPELPLDHTPIDEGPRGKPLTVTCRVKANVGAAKVLVYFRPPRRSSYNSVKMAKVPKTRWTWKGVIPGKALWGSTLQYYILATDDSDKVLAASGSIINPHIISVTSAGGVPATENPFGTRKRIKKKKKVKTGPKRFWIQFGPIFGFGLAMGHVEVIDERGGIAKHTGLPFDEIETPGFAPGSFGGVLEFGYFFFRKLPNLLLSLQGRFGYIGMMTKNVEDAATADFGGSLRVRYFILKFAKGWLRLYAGGGLGFAMIRHAVSLKLEQGNFVDTDKSMGIMPSGFAGLTFGKDYWIQGYVETGFLMTVWTDPELFTFHLDVSIGACFSF